MIYKRAQIILYLCLWLQLASNAQYKSADSVVLNPTQLQQPSLTNFNLLPLRYVGLLAGVGATWHYKHEVRDFRNTNFHQFNKSYDDYLQYAPAVTTFIIKSATKKYRTDLKRTIFGYAISYAIMGIVVNSLKKITRVERPDGGLNSFPSGHTATAFMNARFMEIELGKSSKMYSYTAYTNAVLVGSGRILNNRHWAPDVVAGAGIGVLSVKLGYYLADKIVK